MSVIDCFILRDGWTYQVFSPDTPPSEIPDGHDIKALWDSKRVNANLPAWRDFAFEDFEPWWGWMMVEDILPSDTYDSVFRLWSTGLTRILDVDLTKKRFSDAVGVVYSHEEVSVWQRLKTTHNILRSSGTMDWLKRYDNLYGRSFTDLSFPLSNDGQQVDKYLSVTILT